MFRTTTLFSWWLVISGVLFAAWMLPGSARARAQQASEPRAQGDPAIWRDPFDPARSTLIGERRGYVGIYGLSGKPIQHFGKRSVGIDIRNAVLPSGRSMAVASVTDPALGVLRFYKINPASRGLEPLDTAPSRFLENVSASCLYTRPVSDTHYAFTLSPDGTVNQLQLFSRRGQLKVKRVRTFRAGNDPRACVADDELGFVYIGADTRILKYYAEPSAKPAVLGTIAAAAVDGLTLYRASDRTGYLLASQGSNEILAFHREGDNERAATVSLGEDPGLRVTGIDVVSTPLGDSLPFGALLVQSPGGLRIVPWDRLASSVFPPLTIDPFEPVREPETTGDEANRSWDDDARTESLAPGDATPAASGGDVPNTFALNEPSEYSTSFTTDGLNERVDDFNAVLSVTHELPGLGGLRYTNRIEGVFSTTPPGVYVRNPSGFGVGWELHFGRWIDINSNPSCVQRNEFAFEYPSGARTRQISPTAFPNYSWIALQDGGRIQEFQDGSVRVTSPDGVTYSVDYHVVNQLDPRVTGTPLDEPNLWACGPDGWYATRVEDRNGNFARIEYYGQTYGLNDHSPLPRVVKRGRKVGNVDLVTRVTYLYLDGDSALDQPPLDRPGLKNNARIGAVRFAGPNSASVTALAGDWLTISLSYANHQLTDIAWANTPRRFHFDYYAYNDPNFYARGRMHRITYPSGGQVEYTYDGFYTLNASEHPATGRYYPSNGVRRRTVTDRVTPGRQAWDFYYGAGTYPDGTELAVTFTVYSTEGDPGYRVETWYEPMMYRRHPFSYRTGQMRHRLVYNQANGGDAIREEHQYTAVFENGATRAAEDNYRALVGARAVVEAKAGSTNKVGYLELFRDPNRRDTFTATRIPENGHTDYDPFGNAPYREAVGDLTSVDFSYQDLQCGSASTPCRQDTVTFTGGSPSTYRKDTFDYVIDTDPRTALYEAENLVHLVSRTETTDRQEKLWSANETYYDDDPRRPVEGIPGSPNPGVILGRPSVSVQKHVKDGVEDPAKSPVVSRVFALIGSADRPKGALIEDAVKVNNQGEYRRSKNSYARGSSCVFPTEPTETLFVSSSDGETVLSKVEYNCSGAVRWRQDENGQRTEFRYDQLGRVVKEIQPGDSDAEPTTEYVYDDSGPTASPWQPRRMEVKKASETQVYNSINTFYDGLGRAFHSQQLQSNGIGAGLVAATSSRFFRSSSSVVERTRPYVLAATTDATVYAAPLWSGPRYVTVRDGLGRVVSEQQKTGTTLLREIVHEYGDTVSDLDLTEARVTDEDGRKTVTTYDSLGRITRVTAPDQAQVIYQYDSAGRPEKVTHPDQRESTWVYDGLGRVISKTSPGTGTEMLAYDLTGAVTLSQLAHQAPNYTETTYDERGRIKNRSLRVQITPSIGYDLLEAEYTYDAYAQDTGIVNQDYPKGRLTQVKFGAGGYFDAYGYDAKGRVVEQVFHRYELGTKRVEKEYNRQGLLTQTHYQGGQPDELDLGYTYDENMRSRQVIDRRSSGLCKVFLTGQAVEFTLSSLGPRPRAPRVLASYTHHLDGNILREEWLPCGGSRLQGVDYDRDAFGRLKRINDPSLSPDLDPGHDTNDAFGLELGYEETFQNSVPQRNGNISWMQWSTRGNTLAAYVFTYDERNQLRVGDFWENPTGGWLNTTKYDVNYSYDSLGNVVTQVRRNHLGAASSLIYAYDPGNGRRLSSLSGSIHASFGYDASGNLRFNGRWPGVHSLTYDDRNLLTNANFDTYELAFVYDAAGARVRKQVFPWDPDDEAYKPGDAYYYLPHAVYKNNELLFWQVDDLGRLVPPGSSFGKAGWAFYMRDNLGSVRATVHEDGTILEATDYYPFGMEMPQRSRGSSIRELPQFTGQVRDREFPTTVDYFRARYYDPEIGRFFGPDALRADRPLFSPYAYVMNNPIRFNDPTGNGEEEERRQQEDPLPQPQDQPKKELPTVDDLTESYPNGDAPDVKKEIGGNVNADYITNTCVVRLCAALNAQPGHEIPKNFKASDGTKLTTVKGGDKKRYALRVKEMRKYMTETYGSPDVAEAGGQKGTDAVQGKPGVIMFKVSTWSDASGHFDLWSGSQIVHEQYFSRADSVFLWTTPEKK